MPEEPITLAAGQITGRGRSINPFVIIRDAAAFIAFAEEVFDADEVVEARTAAPTGELIHAELRVGDSLLLIADPQPGWPARPGLFQIWVSDVERLMTRAVNRGAVVVTPPTPFYGSLTLARLEDQWGNLWWVYQPTPG
ncbi:putative glyoxalase superfamily protein PhnB [Nakamurella sp. UYEF19]|uniref:VOC family protein n=1 Tax=Nakamurella sp. UYEF19 TaxID=1756392 RepID=UPI0033946308